MLSDREITARALLRRPSAYLPPLLSLASLALVAQHVVRYGVARQADEGAAAHLWQLMMGLQLLIIFVFAATWVQRAPRAALRVLAVQIVAMLGAMAPVFILDF